MNLVHHVVSARLVRARLSGYRTLIGGPCPVVACGFVLRGSLTTARVQPDPICGLRLPLDRLYEQADLAASLRVFAQDGRTLRS